MYVTGNDEVEVFRLVHTSGNIWQTWFDFQLLTVYSFSGSVTEPQLLLAILAQG